MADAAGGGSDVVARTVAEQMGKTLPRAMAFEPESNFEKFVREFLLEPGMPDVKAVKASVDAHRRAQEHPGDGDGGVRPVGGSQHIACPKLRPTAG